MRRLALQCLLLLPLAAPAPGAIFDRDDRIAVTQPDAHLLPIGVVTGGRNVTHATGFLIGDCHVLTVKHAAGRVASVVGLRMRFRLPSAGRDGTSKASVVAAGDLDLVADPNRLDRSQDWLLLRLDNCLGKRFGWLTLAEAADENDPLRTDLLSAGFPTDRPWRRQLTLDPQCRVRGTPVQLLVHDCSSLPGNSGSPIFTTIWRAGRASLAVLAMHSTASVATRVLPYRSEDGSVATRMTDVIPAIRAHVPGALPLAPVRLAGAATPTSAR